MDGYRYMNCRPPRKPTKDNSPGYEDDFVPLATVRFLVFKVIDCPSAFLLWKVINEFIVILLMPRFSNNDLSITVVKFVKDVIGFLLQFETLEYFNTFGVDSDA